MNQMLSDCNENITTCNELHGESTGANKIYNS